MATVSVSARGGEPVRVRLEQREEGLAGNSFTLEDGSLAGAVIPGEGGEGVLRMGARVVPFFSAKVGEELHLWLEGEVYRFALPEEAERAAAHALPVSGEVSAPMPGQVLKVLASPGDRVAEQAPLAVLESMKMELTITAPVPGSVLEVNCEPGQMVDMGALLFRVEPESAEKMTVEDGAPEGSVPEEGR